MSGLGSCATLDFIVLQAFAVEMSFVSLHARSVASWSVTSTLLITMFLSDLSSRERNLLKRKSRALQRSGSSQGSSKRSKSGSEATDAAVEQAEAEEDGQEWQAVAAGQWPFQAICDQMCIDMLDPVWEVHDPSHVVCDA